VFGRTNNPWNLERTSGGSSGGATAALAAGMTPLEIGSDYGGSIRLPAHFCGVFGLKTTEHRVSMAGHIPDLPSGPRVYRILWSIGPLARSVEDLALALPIIAGADPRDPDVPPLPVGSTPSLALKDLRLAWAPTFPGVPAAAPIREALNRLAAELDRLGAKVEERLPDVSIEEHIKLRTTLSVALRTALAPTEEEPAPMLAEYFTALHRRDELIAAWERFFDHYDAFLCPVAMTTAFAHCETGTPLRVDGEEVKYWRVIGHCGPFNLTGHPVVVVPVGTDPDGLPIGVQIVGKRWGEERLLGIAERLVEVVGPLRFGT
jgi:amidase